MSQHYSRTDLPKQFLELETLKTPTAYCYLQVFPSGPCQYFHTTVIRFDPYAPSLVGLQSTATSAYLRSWMFVHILVLDYASKIG